MVISKIDIIKHMLSKPILHGRIGKWALALTEFSLQYVPQKSIKGQVLAYFIVEHLKGEIESNFVGLKPWKMYFDGSSYSGGVGVGILIISPKEIPTKFQFEIQSACLNNEAEYEALIAGLEILISKGAKQVLIRGDSQLVVK